MYNQELPREVQSDKKSIVHPRHAIYHILDTSCGTGCDSVASKNYRTFPVHSRVTPNTSVGDLFLSNWSFCSTHLLIAFIETKRFEIAVCERQFQNVCTYEIALQHSPQQVGRILQTNFLRFHGDIYGLLASSCYV